MAHWATKGANDDKVPITIKAFCWQCITAQNTIFGDAKTFNGELAIQKSKDDTVIDWRRW